MGVSSSSQLKVSRGPNAADAKTLLLTGLGIENIGFNSHEDCPIDSVDR
jgi:hypothetical protein